MLKTIALVYVLLYWLPNGPMDAPLFVSIWQTAEACEKKAAILNEGFQTSNEYPSFRCVPSNLQGLEDLND